MTKNKVTRRDNGARALLKRISVSGEVTVGIHEAEGSAAKNGDDSGMSVLDIAIIHEFGAPGANILERSFIRAWADEEKARHDEELAKIGRLVIAGKLDAGTALERLGLRRAAEVQARIAKGIEPDIEESTKRAKGSSKPLIDTGQLRSSVTHQAKVSK